MSAVAHKVFFIGQSSGKDFLPLHYPSLNSKSGILFAVLDKPDLFIKNADTFHE